MQALYWFPVRRRCSQYIDHCLGKESSADRSRLERVSVDLTLILSWNRGCLLGRIYPRGFYTWSRSSKAQQRDIDTFPSYKAVSWCDHPQNEGCLNPFWPLLLSLSHKLLPFLLVHTITGLCLQPAEAVSGGVILLLIIRCSGMVNRSARCALRLD